MMQHVNQVFIGNTLDLGAVKADFSGATEAAVEALDNVGKIVIADETYTLVAESTNSNIKEFHIGIVEDQIIEVVTDVDLGTVEYQNVIRWSPAINVAGIKDVISNPYEPVREDTIVVDFTNITVEAGHRYVVRIIYKDLYEHPGQFTHQYEVVAKDGETPATLAAKFNRKINRHTGRRVNSVLGTYAAPTFTPAANGTAIQLTGRVIPELGNTLNPVDYYRQVSMEVVAWVDPVLTNIIANVAYPISDLVIAKITGTPGHGNWKIVRDHENRAQGYRGITYRRYSYPFIHPVWRTVPGETYSEFTMEWETLYRSPDNQYIKNTPLALEVYFAGQTEGTPGPEADLKEAIDNLIKTGATA